VFDDLAIRKQLFAELLHWKNSLSLICFLLFKAPQKAVH